MMQLESPRPAGLLRAKAPLILGVTLLVVALSYLLAGRHQTSYTSSVDVAVEPVVFATGTIGTTPEMGLEKSIASSGAVAGLAANQLAVPVATIQRGLAVTVPVDTDTLHISHTGRTPQEAQRWASAVADAYVKFRNDALPHAGVPPTSTESSVGGVAGRQTNGSVTRAGASRAAIITAASLPTAPNGSGRALTLVVAAVLGLALGLAAAMTADRLDDRVRGAGDLEQLTDLPGLGELHVPGPPEGWAETLGNVGDVQVRYLWSRLRLIVIEQPSGSATNVLAISGSSSSPGLSVLAARLAAVVAASGSRVLLVGRPHAPEESGFGRPLAGLREVLSGRVRPEEVMRSIAPRFAFMPLGDGNGLPLPATSSISHTLEELGQDRDLVILETEPLLESPDGLSLAVVADLVLLAEDRRRATRSGVRRAVAELQRAGCPLVGTVLLRRASHLRQASGRGPKPTWPFRGWTPQTEAEVGRSDSPASRAEEHLS